MKNVKNRAEDVFCLNFKMVQTKCEIHDRINQVGKLVVVGNSSEEVMRMIIHSINLLLKGVP